MYLRNKYISLDSQGYLRAHIVTAVVPWRIINKLDIPACGTFQTV